MKISILMGRGVEGVGLTKNVVEFQRLYKDVKVYATIDKVWNRHNSMDFECRSFKGSNWNQPNRQSKRFGEVYNCEQVLEEINKSDCCIIFSVPSKKHPEDCQSNFLRLIKSISVRKSLVQVDHNRASITRNANLIEICNNVDVIMTHSLANPFCDVLRENGVSTPLTTMGVGYNFDLARKTYWQPIDQQANNVVRWVGRLSGWKGPYVLTDFHTKYLKDLGFITCLEGLESSISFGDMLYVDKEKTILRDVVSYFRGEVKEVPYGLEEIGKGSYLYPPYRHDDMMKRMALSTFGSDLMHFKDDIYGNNVEYCHCDSFGAGVVPLFHKHFGDHVIHRKYGIPVSQHKKSGTLFVDYTNMEAVSKQMKQLSNNVQMRNDYREMAFEFWKEHADAPIVYDDIIDKTMNYKDKDVFYSLFA